MNWYKLSNNADLTTTVKNWLIQAFRGPVDESLVQQDLDIAMSTMDDAFLLQEAIENGTKLAMSQTMQDELNEYQRQLLMTIQNRISSMTSPSGLENPMQQQGIQEQGMPMQEQPTEEMPQV